MKSKLVIILFWIVAAAVLFASAFMQGCAIAPAHKEPPVILVQIPEGITDVELIIKTEDCTGNWNFCKWQ